MHYKATTNYDSSAVEFIEDSAAVALTCGVGSDGSRSGSLHSAQCISDLKCA
jgi:hypothetical protein